MQLHRDQITAADLSTVQADGFTAVVDAYVRDEHEDTIWFLSMLGNQTALKAIAAQLFTLPPKPVYIVEEDPEDPSQDKYLACKLSQSTVGTWTHKILKLPNTKAFHSILYTKKAEYPNESTDFLLLSRSKEQAPDLHYMFLDRRLNIPLHESWSHWLWERGLANNSIVPLQSKGITAYLCKPDADTIKMELSEAISERRLTLPPEATLSPNPTINMDNHPKAPSPSYSPGLHTTPAPDLAPALTT